MAGVSGKSIVQLAFPQRLDAHPCPASGQLCLGTLEVRANFHLTDPIIARTTHYPLLPQTSHPASGNQGDDLGVTRTRSLLPPVDTQVPLNRAHEPIHGELPNVLRRSVSCCTELTLSHEKDFFFPARREEDAALQGRITFLPLVPLRGERTSRKQNENHCLFLQIRLHPAEKRRNQSDHLPLINKVGSWRCGVGEITWFPPSNPWSLNSAHMTEEPRLPLSHIFIGWQYETENSCLKGTFTNSWLNAHHNILTKWPKYLTFWEIDNT